MRPTLLAVYLLILTGGAVAAPAMPSAADSAEAGWKGGAIPMVFSNTEVGQALRAIGLRTGVDVVYVAGKERASVALNVTASNPAEAIRCVASAAGLAIRRVGKLYVVAAPNAMRQALEPYALSTSLPVESGDADLLAGRLQEAYPYATVRASGDRISVVGAPEDVDGAAASLRDLQATAAGRRSVADVVRLERSVPTLVAPLVSGMYADVKVVPTPGEKAGGALALSGPLASVDAARELAKKIDSQEPADGEEFRVYDIRYASASSLVELLKQAAPNVQAFAGPEAFLPKRAVFNPLAAGMSDGASILGGGSATAGAAGGTGSTPTAGGTAPTSSPASDAKPGDRAKALVLRGRRSELDAAMKLLTNLDRKPRQVVVEVNVIETSPENDSSTGVLYDWQPFHFVESGTGSLIPSDSSVTKPAGLGQFTRIPWDFTATLNAKITSKEAKILAKPRISVVDNGEASVFVGDTIRARIVSSGALGAQTVEIQSFPVGIILLIAPRVNADGNITLHVNPVVSTVTSVDANNVPQTSVREAETTAIVKSGETVVLGGLIRDEDIKTVESVPFLSKLPIVGELFKNRTRNHRRSDVLVSITPRLVADEEGK